MSLCLVSFNHMNRIDLHSRRGIRPATLSILIVATAMLSTFLTPNPVLAQIGSAAPSGAAGAAVGSGAPGGAGPAASVGGGVPTTTPTHPLTLTDVVNIAVGNNSGIVAARQRLQQAQELINQVNAQGKPQIGAFGSDILTNYRAYPPVLATPTITNPTLPGGGVIPTLVDAAGNISTSFIGGGGGGNVPSGGIAAPTFSATPAAPTGASSLPAPGATGTTPSSTGTTPAGATGTGVVAPGTGVAAPGTPAVPAGGTSAPTGAGTAPTGTGSGGTAAPASGGAAMAFLSAAPLIADYLTQATSHAIPSTSESTPVAPAPDVPEQAEVRMGSELSAPLASGTDKNPDGSGAAQADEAGNDGSRDQTANDPTTQPKQTSSVSTPSSASAGPPQYNNFAGRVSISQYLDVFGLIGTARDAEKNVRDFYALDIDRLRNETALAAKNLFFNVLLAQAQVDTETEQVRYATENVRITKSRLAQGIVSNFDVLTAEAALSTAQQQLISAQDQRDLAQATLSYLLGTNPDVPVTLVSPALPPLDATVDIAASTKTALANRPEIHQAQSNVQEAQRLVRLAGSTLMPALGLVGSAFDTSETSESSPQSYAEIEAEIDVPIDDAGATRSRVRSAKVDVDAQVLALNQLTQSIGLEVREAAVNVRNAQAQIGAAQTGLAQAQEAVRLARERYGAGVGTFLDVLNALAELAVTRTNLANAQYFYQTSLALLVRAMGGR